MRIFPSHINAATIGTKYGVIIIIVSIAIGIGFGIINWLHFLLQ
jgi:hypothetical protein